MCYISSIPKSLNTFKFFYSYKSYCMTWENHLKNSQRDICGLLLRNFLKYSFWSLKTSVPNWLKLHEKERPEFHFVSWCQNLLLYILRWSISLTHYLHVWTKLWAKDGDRVTCRRTKKLKGCGVPGGFFALSDQKSKTMNIRTVLLSLKII